MTRRLEPTTQTSFGWSLRSALIKIVLKYENQLRSVNITQEDFESIIDPTDIAEMMQLLIKGYLRTKDR